MRTVHTTALPLLLALTACGAAPTNGETTATTAASGPVTSSSGAAVASPDAGAEPAAVVPAEDAGATAVVTPDAATPAPAQLRFVIAPLHLVPAPGATGGDARVDLELAADGTLRSHGGYVGQFVGDRVLGRDGRELIAIAPDGTVSMHGSATQIRFAPDGSITMPNGARLTFADDGTPLAVSPQGQSAPGPARLVGYRPELRATASLLGLLVATTSLANGPAQ